ncbi:MAG: hypothetical protein RIM99_03970 [Cyclobacteriaceae bacterium]
MLEVQEVKTKKELISFIKFPFTLYKDNEYYVPPLIDFELTTLRKDKNPAFDHADAAYWLVKKDGKIAGRIAGIIIDAELREKSMIRFGWVDFIDDPEISELLFKQLSDWGRLRGAKQFHGPLGFTDLDFEGALTSGFDQEPTQATIYNYPYYIKHYENLGLEISATWKEFRGVVPDEVPRRIKRSADLVQKRFNFKLKKFKSSKEIADYMPHIFSILNEGYSHLYAYHPLSERQVKYYTDLYIGLMKKDYTGIVLNDKDEVIAMAVCMPSLSRALKKAKGRMFPFGFIHLIKAYFSNKVIDMFLIGARSEYQKLGANAVIFSEMAKIMIKNKAEKFTTGPMLLENRAALNNWESNKELLEDVEITRSCFLGKID